MIAKRCDRCGQYYVPQRGKSGAVMLHGDISSGQIQPEKPIIDVCEHCMQKLREFLMLEAPEDEVEIEH